MDTEGKRPWRVTAEELAHCGDLGMATARDICERIKAGEETQAENKRLREALAAYRAVREAKGPQSREALRMENARLREALAAMLDTALACDATAWGDAIERCGTHRPCDLAAAALDNAGQAA
jgi:hypothetical protein